MREHGQEMGPGTCARLGKNRKLPTFSSFALINITSLSHIALLVQGALKIGKEEMHKGEGKKKKKKKKSVSKNAMKVPKGGGGPSKKKGTKGTITSSGSGCSQNAVGDNIGIASETICVDWIPGIGFSQECEKEETETQGGGVCNLVSKAWLYALVDDHDVDVVLNQAGLCRADLAQGPVTPEDIKKILPNGYHLVLIETTGENIVDALEQAAVAAYKGDPGSYPYGSGIRFKVDYKRDKESGFVYDVEVNSGLAEDWHSIVLSGYYLVAANEVMAVDITASKKVTLDYTDVEVFLDYAMTVCVLEDPPLSEYSTQYFDGLQHLISSTDAYSCLQDDSLCNCGFC